MQKLRHKNPEKATFTPPPALYLKGKSLIRLTEQICCHLDVIHIKRWQPTPKYYSPSGALSEAIYLHLAVHFTQIPYYLYVVFWNLLGKHNSPYVPVYPMRHDLALTVYQGPQFYHQLSRFSFFIDIWATMDKEKIINRYIKTQCFLPLNFWLWRSAGFCLCDLYL